MFSQVPVHLVAHAHMAVALVAVMAADMAPLPPAMARMAAAVAMGLMVAVAATVHHR